MNQKIVKFDLRKYKISNPIIKCLLLVLSSCLMLVGCNNVPNKDSDVTKSDNADIQYISFGYYPQSLATDQAVAEMSETANQEGYYISSYDNCKYIKASGNQLESGYKFDNSETIIKDKIYFFKVEPIIWIILNEDENGNVLLMSEKVLWFGAFQNNYVNKNAEWYNSDVSGDIYANDWEHSDVRNWLNDNFIKDAFDNEQQNKIQLANTFEKIGYEFPDKIFFLSAKEITNKEFGFSADHFEEDKMRVALTTDYARAQGAWISTKSKDYGSSSFYWLRSVNDDSSLFAAFVNSYGGLPAMGNDVASKKGGYRPAIVVNKYDIDT